MKKGIFIVLCSLVLFSFVCALPPTLTGEKQHVSSANLGEKVLVTYSFNHTGDPQMDENSERQGADVILILDVSTSMSEEKLSSAKNASKIFLGRLNSSIDRVGVGKITKYDRLVLELTSDFKSVVSAIDGLSRMGDTSGADVISQSIDNLILDDNRSGALKIVFLFTDGVFNNPSTATEPEAIKKLVNSSTSYGIKTYTSFFGSNPNSNAARFLEELAEIGHGEYFHSPTGEDLVESFLNVSQIIRENVASDFVLNDSFLSGVKVLDDGFPSECRKDLIGKNFSISCEMKKIFSLSDPPFNFSFFVNVTSPTVNKLSTNSFVSYKNYSGKESILFLNDLDFSVNGSTSIPDEGEEHCNSTSDYFCSSSDLGNATLNSSLICPEEESCYSCNEGFIFNDLTKKCVLDVKICEDLGGYCSPVLMENGARLVQGNCQIGDCYTCKEGYLFDSSHNCVNSNEAEWICESDVGFSYWYNISNQSQKEWIYSSSEDQSLIISKCDKYGNSFCCPNNFICDPGTSRCVLNPNTFDFCSSLESESSCNSAPREYAKKEILSFEIVNLSENACLDVWYRDDLNESCSLKSSCSCVWNSDLEKCSSSENIVNSCNFSSGEDPSPDGGSTPTGGNSKTTRCLYTQIRQENNCSTTGYYFREFLATAEGGYPLDKCQNISQTISCSQNLLSLPFFGIFNFFIVLVIVFLFAGWRIWGKR